MQAVHSQLVAPLDDAESWLRSARRALHVDGDLQASRRLYDSAYVEAERAGDNAAMARAALGLGGLWLNEHRTVAASALVEARQQRGLSLVEPRSALALRLRIRLAGEADYRTGTSAAILAMVQEARRFGDPVTLAEALSLAHHCVLGPDQGAVRRKLADELVSVAAGTGRRGDEVMALLWRTVDAFLAGDPYAERQLEELRGLLAEQGHGAAGFIAGAIEVTLAIRAGRLDQAEALAKANAERGAGVGDADATGWYGAQMVAIRWYQGRLGELLPMLSELAHSPTLSDIDNSLFAALAASSANAGDRRQAAGTLAMLIGRDLTNLPRSSTWLVSMYGMVEAAYLLEDAETAALAYAMTVPYARLPMMASIGIACFGSTHQALGLAGLAIGEPDLAVRHLQAAVDANLALRHWPAVALSRHRLGQALYLLGGPDNAVRARQELAAAAREAARMGMALPGPTEPGPTEPGLTKAGPTKAGLTKAGCTEAGSTKAGRTEAGRTEAGPAVIASGAGEGAQARPAHGGRRGHEQALCERRGRGWRIELAGRAVLIEHSVGMLHLSALLANPGVEIPAVDLAAGPGHAGAAGPGKAQSTQPVLDDVAKREYRERLARLQAEIDELECSDDPSRADVPRSERDWLLAELAAAAGMGGRVRQFATGEERARVAVGKAIRRALDRIAKADPFIGEELRATVQTGLRCCYRPR